jgi:hypothetical protein
MEKIETDIVLDKNNLIETVNNLLDKYKENDYMYQKINNYINNQLSGIFETMNDQHNQRVIRMTELTSEQDTFIQAFLNNNQYFYSSSTDNFFFYDGTHYQLYNEDDILHEVLNKISRDSSLMSWKQKTRLNIMKRIRETNLLQSIPESQTIQSVIDSICPLLFTTRAEAKLFLTVLGDNIFRKQQSLIYIIDPNAKFFLKQLNHMCQMFIGCNLSQTFKHKYYDHKYEDCRILKINRSIKNDSTWGQILNKNILDLICISCHYSLRYNSADVYINNYCNSDKLIENVFYIKNMNIDTLVNDFIENVLDIDIISKTTSSSITQVTWKNMQYLWKQFLTDKDLPALVFLQPLKTMLIEKLKPHYLEDKDTFSGICSKYLPVINTFLSFWNETMVEDDLESELEIEEVILLFRKWCETNNQNISNINDKKVLDLLSYYYPQIEIEQDKYIGKVRCLLWDKQLEIQIAMDNLKVDMQNKAKNMSSNSLSRMTSPGIYHNISIYDAYTHYSKYTTTASSSNLHNKQRQIVSKVYFDKYIFDNYQEYIIESKIISCDWYML